MKIVFVSLFLFLSHFLIAQIDIDISSDSLHKESFESVESYTIVDSKLLNKEKVFKKIYRKAKRRDLLNGNTIIVSVFVDSSGKLLSTEFYGQDSSYTFIRKIFLNKAKYSAPKTSHNKSVRQIFGEYITLSKEFLLGGYKFQTNYQRSAYGYEPITSFDDNYLLKVDIAKVLHNGSWHKIQRTQKEKVKNQRSSIIQITDSLHIYFEFPRIIFQNEKYYGCRYIIKEKTDNGWDVKCESFYSSDIKKYGVNFFHGIVCGVLDDPLRLELKMTASFEKEE